MLEPGRMTPPTYLRKVERAPHPRIIEGRALGVKHNQEIREPRAFTDVYAVAEGLDEVVALRGCHTAKLGGDATTLVPPYHCIRGDEIRLVAIEIGSAG
jgi:hypothetical protein